MTLANSSDARTKSSTSGPLFLWLLPLSGWSRERARVLAELDQGRGIRGQRLAAGRFEHGGARSPLPMALFLTWTCSMISWIGESSPALAPGPSPAASKTATSSARAGICRYFVFITASLFVSTRSELPGGSLERRVDNCERPQKSEEVVRKPSGRTSAPRRSREA